MSAGVKKANEFFFSGEVFVRPRDPKKKNRKKAHREGIWVSRGDERLRVENSAVLARVHVGFVDDLRKGKRAGSFCFDGRW